MPRSRVDASAPSQPRWRALCVSTAPSVHTPREFIHHSQERYVLMEPLAKPRLLHPPSRCLEPGNRIPTSQWPLHLGSTPPNRAYCGAFAPSHASQLARSTEICPKHGLG